MKPAAFYVLPAILLIALIACSQPTDPVNDGDDLLKVVWKLDSLQTPAGKDVPTAARHTSIHFTEDMEIRVGQSCRDYDGSYELGPGQSLSISLLDSTEEHCLWPDWVTDFNTLFIGALRKIESYNTDGDRLTLQSGQNDYVLYFSIEVRDSSLANILWKLDTLQTAAETIVPNPDEPVGHHITIVFFDRWLLAAASPCWYYVGDYDLGKNDSMGVYGLNEIATAGCLYPDLEQTYFQAIESLDSYSRDDERLILYNQDRSTRLSYSIGAVDEALTKTLYPYWAYYTFETPRIWRLDSLRTPEGKIIPDPENNLTIMLTKGLAAWIESKCNDYSGYSGYFSNPEPGALTFDMGAGYLSPVVCTELDSIFLYALEKVQHYDMTGDKLTLRDSQDDYVLYFTDK